MSSAFVMDVESWRFYSWSAFFARGICKMKDSTECEPANRPSGVDVSADWPVVQRLDAALAALEEGDTSAENAMESALAEVEDLISYCNDILCTGVARAPDLPANSAPARSFCTGLHRQRPGSACFQHQPQICDGYAAQAI